MGLGFISGFLDVMSTGTGGQGFFFLLCWRGMGGSFFSMLKRDERGFYFFPMLKRDGREFFFFFLFWKGMRGERVQIPPFASNRSLSRFYLSRRNPSRFECLEAKSVTMSDETFFWMNFFKIYKMSCTWVMSCHAEPKLGIDAQKTNKKIFGQQVNK
jgi:hypothetical protein